MELCRRLGRFDEAQQRLTAFSVARPAALPWLSPALAAQARRIADKNAAPDDGRDPPPRPPR